MSKQILFTTIKKCHISLIIELLYERQEIERSTFSHLKFDNNLSDLMAELKNRFSSKEIIGVGAFYDDCLIGYLVGEVTIDKKNQKSIYVSYEGMAIKQGYSHELMRQLYSNAASLWIEQECFEHSIVVPLGSNQYYDAFQHLSFAIEQVYAVLNIDEYKPFERDTSITIREANINDRSILKTMSQIILKVQNGSPTFAKVNEDLALRVKLGYEALIDGNDIILLACKEDQVCGFHVYETIVSSMMIPSNGILLDVAATRFECMNQGVGKTLMNEGVEFAIKMGYKYMQTDWKVTNLSSSIFWPRCGFKPMAYRLARKIDKDYGVYIFD